MIKKRMNLFHTFYPCLPPPLECPPPDEPIDEEKPPPPPEEVVCVTWVTYSFTRLFSLLVKFTPFLSM